MSQFTYWYPIAEEKQLDFDKREHVKEVYCEGHIICNGRIRWTKVLPQHMKVGSNRLVMPVRRTSTN